MAEGLALNARITACSKVKTNYGNKTMSNEQNESDAKAHPVDTLVKVDDVVICLIDEWKTGKKTAFDCNVLSKNEKGVDVVYLSGYRSRNDFVEWDDIVAKVDKSLPWISLAKEYSFSGNFHVFKP